MYSKTLNPSQQISRGSSVGSAIDLESKGCWFEPMTPLFFFQQCSPVGNLYRWRSTIRMNEAWRIKWDILVSDKILIFSLFVGCIYHKGPALNSEWTLIQPTCCTFIWMSYICHFEVFSFWCDIEFPVLSHEPCSVFMLQFEVDICITFGREEVDIFVS